MADVKSNGNAKYDNFFRADPSPKAANGNGNGNGNGATAAAARPGSGASTGTGLATVKQLDLSAAVGGGPSGGTSTSAGVLTLSVHDTTARTGKPEERALIQLWQLLQPLKAPSVVPPPASAALFALGLAKSSSGRAASDVATGFGLQAHHKVVDACRIMEDVLTHAALSFCPGQAPKALQRALRKAERTHNATAITVGAATSGASAAVTELLQDVEALNGSLADAVLTNRALRNALCESAARQVSDVRTADVIHSVEALIALYRRYMLVSASHAAQVAAATAAAADSKAAAFALTARGVSAAYVPPGASTPPNKDKDKDGPAAGGAAAAAAASAAGAGAATGPLYTRPYSASGVRPTTPASGGGGGVAALAGGSDSAMVGQVLIPATECGCSGPAHAHCRFVPDKWRTAHARVPTATHGAHWDEDRWAAHQRPLHNTTLLSLADDDDTHAAFDPTQPDSEDERDAEAAAKQREEDDEAQRVRQEELQAVADQLAAEAEEKLAAAQAAAAEATDDDEDDDGGDAKAGGGGGGGGSASARKKTKPKSKKHKAAVAAAQAAADEAQRAADAAAKAAAAPPAVVTVTPPPVPLSAAEQKAADDAAAARALRKLKAKQTKHEDTQQSVRFHCIVCHSLLVPPAAVAYLHQGFVWTHNDVQLPGVKLNYNYKWKCTTPKYSVASKEVVAQGGNTVAVQCATCHSYVGRLFRDLQQYRFIYIHPVSGQNYLYTRGSRSVAALPPLLVDDAQLPVDTDMFERRHAYVSDDEAVVRGPGLRFCCEAGASPYTPAPPHPDSTDALFPPLKDTVPERKAKARTGLDVALGVLQSLRARPDPAYDLSHVPDDAIAASHLRVLLSTDVLFRQRRVMDDVSQSLVRLFTGFPNGVYRDTHHQPVVPVHLSFFTKPTDFTQATGTARYVWHYLTGGTDTYDLDTTRKEDDPNPSPAPGADPDAEPTPPPSPYTRKRLEAAIGKITAAALANAKTAGDGGPTSSLAASRLAVLIRLGGVESHTFVLLKVDGCYRVLQSNGATTHPADRFTLVQWLASPHRFAQTMDFGQWNAWLQTFDRALKGDLTSYLDLFAHGKLMGATGDDKKTAAVLDCAKPIFAIRPLREHWLYSATTMWWRKPLDGAARPTTAPEDN